MHRGFLRRSVEEGFLQVSGQSLGRNEEGRKVRVMIEFCFPVFLHSSLSLSFSLIDLN